MLKLLLILVLGQCQTAGVGKDVHVWAKHKGLMSAESWGPSNASYTIGNHFKHHTAPAITCKCWRCICTGPDGRCWTGCCNASRAARIVLDIHGVIWDTPDLDAPIVTKEYGIYNAEPITNIYWR